MTCPRPGDDSCTSQVPCDPCPSCRWCGESWQRHIDGNACSAPQSPVSPCSGVRDGRDGAGWYWETPRTAERRTGPMCAPVHMTEETR